MPAAFALQGTVLIRSAEELENYSKSEEARIEEIIKSIAGQGARQPGAEQGRAVAVQKCGTSR